MTRDELAALERALRETEPPDAGPARERARRTVLAQAPSRRRARRAAPLVWAALAALLAALVVTQRDSGPAQAVERMVRDIVNEPAPTPVPVSDLSLPAAGRLLVSGSDGLYVVARDGRRTRLGRWDDATWSPQGLFVGATAGRTLAAIEPTDGTVRWRLRPGPPVSLPRWAPDGTHIAYRAGDTLRIVYGNGSHDVAAGQDMAAVAPAWRPSDRHTIAWAAKDGTVTVEDADTAKVLRTFRGSPVRRLAWSGDGRRLLVAGRTRGVSPRPGDRPDAPARTRAAANSCSPRPTHPPATASRSPSCTTTAPSCGSAPRSCAPSPAASTTSNGRPTGAGCWRAGPAPASGCSRTPPAARTRPRSRSRTASARPHARTAGAARHLEAIAGSHSRAAKRLPGVNRASAL